MRILAIDYGSKRTGIAITDELQLIASALTTIETTNLLSFLKTYFLQEQVEKVIIGSPSKHDGTPSESKSQIDAFIVVFKNNFPSIPILTLEERFTSKIAFQAMIASGISKKKRQYKGLVDQIAATILLQDYLQYYK
jgi:putative holliday junction resolvase